MTDKVLEKIKKLLALAGNNSSVAEAQAAMLKAQELMLKYHIENPETISEDKVVACFHDLGSRAKTEDVLLVSVLVANNFRARTLHSGNKIYFFGFEADAKAAIEVFTYLVEFSDAAHDRYFAKNTWNKQAEVNWRFGFIAGLNTAFNSRTGFELMLQVPEKVDELYKKVVKPDTASVTDNKVTTLKGAFTDGFRRGRESMSKREIEMVQA